MKVLTEIEITIMKFNILMDIDSIDPEKMMAKTFQSSLQVWGWLNQTLLNLNVQLSWRMVRKVP